MTRKRLVALGRLVDYVVSVAVVSLLVYIVLRFCFEYVLNWLTLPPRGQ